MTVLSKIGFKLPKCLQCMMLPYMDAPDMTPTMFKDENLFATMINQNLKSIEINLKALTIVTTYQDGSKGIVVHPLDLDNLQMLWARIKDKMRMDMSKRDSETNSIRNMMVGIIICPQEFECTHDSYILTLSIKN
jgi:hypothetical protein